MPAQKCKVSKMMWMLVRSFWSSPHACCFLFCFCFCCRSLIVNQILPIPLCIRKTYRLFAHLWLTYFLMFATHTNANSMRQQVRDKHIEFGKVSLMLMSDLVLNQNILLVPLFYYSYKPPDHSSGFFKRSSSLTSLRNCLVLSRSLFTYMTSVCVVFSSTNNTTDAPIFCVCVCSPSKPK